MYFLGDSAFLEAKSIQVFRRPLVAYSFRGSFLWSLVSLWGTENIQKVRETKGTPHLLINAIDNKQQSLVSDFSI